MRSSASSEFLFYCFKIIWLCLSVGLLFAYFYRGLWVENIMFLIIPMLIMILFDAYALPVEIHDDYMKVHHFWRVSVIVYSDIENAKYAPLPSQLWSRPHYVVAVKCRYPFGRVKILADDVNKVKSMLSLHGVDVLDAT